MTVFGTNIESSLYVSKQVHKKQKTIGQINSSVMFCISISISFSKNLICQCDLRMRKLVSHFTFLTASKYCGSGLKIDLVVLAVVVVVILVLVIKLLSNSTAFVGFDDKLNILCDGKIFFRHFSRLSFFYSPSDLQSDL